MKDLLRQSMFFMIGIGLGSIGVTVGMYKCEQTHAYETRTFTVTGYCAGECCCGIWADGKTASNVDATGLIIAAPPDIPFGTVIDVPGCGRGVVQDRGSAIQGDKIDLLFEDKDGLTGHQRALNWGKRDVECKVWK